MSAHPRELRSGPMPVATLLAAAAVAACAYPLGRLFEESPWWPTALGGIGVVVVTGLVLRARGVASGVVALVQMLGVILVHTVGFAPAQPLLGGLIPTWSTLEHWRDLGVEAGQTIMANAAPAPAPTGIAFALSAAIGLVAWAVDVVAVGSRMPAVAGLPLLTCVLTAIANSSGTLGVAAIAAPLVLWGAMLLEQERDWLAQWRPDLAVAHRLPARGARLGAGTALLVAGLLAGIGTAAVLPHLPQRYLAEGLGRGELGNGHRIGFSPDTDLLQDLNSGDNTPILTYSSDDPEAPPLRVTVASAYSLGHWTPWPATAVPSQAPVLPRPKGLSGSVPGEERHLKVAQTTLRQPYLASPVPIVWGTVVGALWAVDDPSGMPVVNAIPHSYDLTYLSLTPSPETLAGVPPVGRREFPQDLDVPPEVDTQTFQAALRAAIGDAATPYDRAVRIQNWLRDTDRFTYSLELAPVPQGIDDTAAKRTAVDRFLQTRRGYCVQFATTMVMMARAADIPARLASGFLPGTPQGAGRTVVAADAHAWPELYFEGAGWLRFEPTPSERSGSVPPYAAGVGAPTPTPSTSSVATNIPTVTPPPNEPTDRRDVDTQPDEGTVVEESAWWPVLRVLGGVAILASIVPAVAAGVRARRRAVARDRSRDAVAETEWLILAERLRDLGLEVPVAATPRQVHARVTDTAVLDREASAALGRVLLAVQEARYARPDPQGGRRAPNGSASDQAAGQSRSADAAKAHAEAEAEADAALRADARAVVRGAASLRSASYRVRAALLPRAGLRALRLPAPGGRTPPTSRH